MSQENAGCSWIKVRNEVSAFVTGTCNYSHPYMEETCKMLHNLEFEMKNPSIKYQICVFTTF
ncbi:hypothetical protein Ddye_021782 [Dipteronia dyeriana]|uniref:Uncharacterized protein n=1 Tax=Dipteronia dyeriana TaxID=168575 RepID=A0AAD9U2U1_9ROSI|nr:hypothetical protein Ddye_021782 [Dipteronia dyeriana]